ncbi:hypothetical protein Bbelb_324680 [Branchiostoma belcheri]|nr:hypothetical protein Bbelb_324680 [Branchiostoma belcheri]
METVVSGRLGAIDLFLSGLGFLMKPVTSNGTTDPAAVIAIRGRHTAQPQDILKILHLIALKYLKCQRLRSEGWRMVRQLATAKPWGQRLSMVKDVGMLSCLCSTVLGFGEIVVDCGSQREDSRSEAWRTPRLRMGRLKFAAVWRCLAAILFLLEQLPVCSPEVDEADGYGSGSDPDRTFVVFSPSAAAPFTPSDVTSNGSDLFFAPIVIERMTEPPSELLSRTRRTSLIPDVGAEKEYFFRRDFPPTASEEVEQSWYADYEYEDGEMPQNDEPYKPGTPEEDVHIVSCQMDVACNPNDPLAKCTCKNQIEAFGEARCIIPKARVSHISMANSGKMNVFCVGVTLTPPDSDSDYEMQTRCKYYGGNNEKYKVYVTKKVELDELSATEKVRYRACLEPLKD